MPSIAEQWKDRTARRDASWPGKWEAPNCESALSSTNTQTDQFTSTKKTPCPFSYLNAGRCRFGVAFAVQRAGRCVSGDDVYLAGQSFRWRLWPESAASVEGYINILSLACEIVWEGRKEGNLTLRYRNRTIQRSHEKPGQRQRCG